MAKIKGLWKFKEGGTLPQETIGQRINIKNIQIKVYDSDVGEMVVISNCDGITFKQYDDGYYAIWFHNNYSLWENDNTNTEGVFYVEPLGSSPTLTSDYAYEVPLMDFGTEDQDVQDWFYEWVSKNMILANYRSIKGTWKRDSAQRYPYWSFNIENDLLPIKFTNSAGEEYVGVEHEVDDLGNINYWAVSANGDKELMLTIAH